MNDAIHYRIRAAEFREMAAQSADPLLADLYLELVRDYEALAERTESTAASGTGHWRPCDRA